MFAGCGEVTPIITSTPPHPTALPPIFTPTSQNSSTVAPPFIHYTPSNGFNIHLEFDYPGSWGFTEAKREAGLMFISLGDPRFRILPTPAAEDFHPIPNDFGSIDVWVKPERPGQTIETVIESHKQGYSNIYYITALNNYSIKIDGVDAIVFEDQIDFPELYSSLMFERNIFFVVKDQIYQITFRIAEKDRGGEFEQGYEYFFNSLEIVP